MSLDAITYNCVFSCNIITLNSSDNSSNCKETEDNESCNFHSSCITSVDLNVCNPFHDSIDTILNYLLCQELSTIVLNILKEETDTICSYSSSTETYIYADERGIKGNIYEIEEAQSCRSLTSSVVFCNSNEVEDHICQVEVVDEKQNFNEIYGLTMIRRPRKIYSMKDHCPKTICSLNFLLKTEKIRDELNNLLHNHIQNKEILSLSEKILIQDRRLISIEQSTKCSFNFPDNLKVLRYKGTNCIRMRITSFSDLHNVQALNLFKIKIPKLYNECIFTEQIFKPNLESKRIHSPFRRRTYLLERPITELYKTKCKKSLFNYSEPLDSVNSEN